MNRIAPAALLVGIGLAVSACTAGFPPEAAGYGAHFRLCGTDASSDTFGAGGADHPRGR